MLMRMGKKMRGSKSGKKGVDASSEEMGRSHSHLRVSDVLQQTNSALAYAIRAGSFINAVSNRPAK